MSADNSTTTTPLTAFAENGLTAIYTSTNPDEFATAFDAFYSTRLSVTVNGKETPRSEFRDLLWDPKLNERSGKVTFAGAVQASESDDELQSSGIVGIFLNANLAVGGDNTLTQEIITASYKLTIGTGLRLVEQVSHAPGSSLGDPRRVIAVDVVMTSETVY